MAIAVCDSLRAAGINASSMALVGAPELVRSICVINPELVLLEIDSMGSTECSLRTIDALARADTDVIALTGSRDAALHGMVIEAGAIGIVDKYGSVDRLVDTLNHALSGGDLMSLRCRHELLEAARLHREASRGMSRPLSQLSSREAQVLGMMMDGLTAESIASMTFVSLATVRTHIRGILTKLGVSSQLAAVAHANRASWRPTNDPAASSINDRAASQSDAAAGSNMSGNIIMPSGLAWDADEVGGR